MEITIVFYFRGTRDILGMKHDLNSHKDCWYTLLSDATYRVGHSFFTQTEKRFQWGRRVHHQNPGEDNGSKKLLR